MQQVRSIFNQTFCLLLLLFIYIFVHFLKLSQQQLTNSPETTMAHENGSVTEAEPEVVGKETRKREREKREEKKKEKEESDTHVKRCVSMAVRLPNGRSPRQPLRTLSPLLSLSLHRHISLYSSIYPSTTAGPPHSLHPSHASNRDPHHSGERAASTPKGAALASKFRITSTIFSGVGQFPFIRPIYAKLRETKPRI